MIETIAALVVLCAVCGITCIVWKRKDMALSRQLSAFNKRSLFISLNGKVVATMQEADYAQLCQSIHRDKAVMGRTVLCFLRFLCVRVVDFLRLVPLVAFWLLMYFAWSDSDQVAQLRDKALLLQDLIGLLNVAVPVALVIFSIQSTFGWSRSNTWRLPAHEELNNRLHSLLRTGMPGQFVVYPAETFTFQFGKPDAQIIPLKK